LPANLKNLRWIHESPAYWDADKARLIGSADPGTFGPEVRARAEGSVLGGDWWRVEAEGKTIGYGWMDATWGDAEISLVVDPHERGRGIGTYVLEHLEVEAKERGLHYLYNEVQPSHPENDALTQWLETRKFAASDDGKLARAIVRASAARTG
jgi:GNAT superfamily N-acetyltransferase